jgi:hypothetical protein
VRDEGLALLLEQLARQVVNRAGTGRGVVELARTAADQLHEFLEAAGVGAPGIHHQHLRHAGHLDQRHKVFFDVVVQLGVHAGRHHVVGAAHEQVVAVGRQFGRDGRTQGTARAAPVVDDQRLARQLGELRRQRPRKGIGAAAGRKRHDQRDRLAGPGGLRAQHGRQCHGGGAQKDVSSANDRVHGRVVSCRGFFQLAILQAFDGAG